MVIVSGPSVPALFRKGSIHQSLMRFVKWEEQQVSIQQAFFRWACRLDCTAQSFRNLNLVQFPVLKKCVLNKTALTQSKEFAIC